ncbi:type II toxin-antitoxin system VapC family toxin [Acaryochloris sp. CCMEE 5410]|uniref:type II toxin-antitoxin system VapC family toxin n=1 Tax=Acaryochloris sp. CCMEE 5410 TaxID=310037 RepID=UPI00024840AE|nr:PIN domain-containing protein [Acaryochloris sp. CCMEE 5410]KAI9133393.1 type II toxin-antitoxin system VapC family toxin [Acaryochloris sp. CCMEE 5410]
MLLDTSGLLCLHYPAEPSHTQALSAYKSAARLVTHNYIVAEYVALANARRFPRKFALDFVVDLVSNPQIETVWVDQPLHQAAVKLLTMRLDKTYSLCDAVSFELMRQCSITEALTTDKHFEQEGFIRLLKF